MTVATVMLLVMDTLFHCQLSRELSATQSTAHDGAGPAEDVMVLLACRGRTGASVSVGVCGERAGGVAYFGSSERDLMRQRR
jgi:hypothetical protein